MKALISDHVHPYLLHYFSSKEIEYDYLPNIQFEEVDQVIDQYEIVIVNSKIKLPKHRIDCAKKLLIVGRLGSGQDGIDIEYLKEKNIHFVRTPEANANAVAEHAMGMLLTLNNHLIKADYDVRHKMWHREKHRGVEIEKQVLGIVGYGHVGSIFAKKMSAWSHSIVCYDRYKENYSKDFINIEEVSIEHIQEHADIISFHVPLTKETNQWVDQGFIDKCKPGVTIINTSRGNIIKTVDLVNALENGQVKGACLDVFENEKPLTYSISDDQVYRRLHSLPNVVLSPHIAGWTHDSFFKISKLMSEKIDMLIAKFLFN